MAKIIIEKLYWDKVYRDLEKEVIKTSTYDDFIIQLMGDLKDKKVLDYGSGPGVMAKALHDYGAIVDVYDINEKILKMATKRINSQRIIYNKEKIAENYYDFVLCNLVVCIVDHDEVLDIAVDIYDALNSKSGIAFIGFCNPLIYQFHETNLDIRHSGNLQYNKNHMYLKEKKEGNYVIPEMHRPIHWYDQIFEKSGLKIIKKIFTPSYDVNGDEISDFIIYKLGKQ